MGHSTCTTLPIFYEPILPQSVTSFIVTVLGLDWWYSCRFSTCCVVNRWWESSYRHRECQYHPWLVRSLLPCSGLSTPLGLCAVRNHGALCRGNPAVHGRRCRSLATTILETFTHLYVFSIDRRLVVSCGQSIALASWSGLFLEQTVDSLSLADTSHSSNLITETH